MTTSPCDLKTTSSRNSREDDRDMGGQEEFSVRVFSSTDWGSQFPTRSVVCVPIPISTLSLAAMAEIHKVNYSKLVWLRPPQPRLGSFGIRSMGHFSRAIAIIREIYSTVVAEFYSISTAQMRIL